MQHFHKWLRWSKYITTLNLTESQVIEILKNHFPAEAYPLAAADNNTAAMERVLKLADQNSPIERVRFNMARNDP